MRFLFIIILNVFFSFFNGCSSQKDELLEELAINVKDSNREFFFTNKISGFYYSNTNSNSTSGWHGWHVNEKKILDDYSFFSDISTLDKISASVKVYPYQLKKFYTCSMVETFAMADSVDALLIKLENVHSVPLIKFNFPESITSATLNSNRLKIVVNNYSFILHSASNITSYKINDKELTINFLENKDIKIILEFLTANNSVLTINNFELIIDKKIKRIQSLLENSYVETNDKELNKALKWNKITLDALLTSQGNINGIWAGLPWFNNYWGRDTFISLPGATFTQNNFEDAKKILTSFAEHQDKNPGSKYFGRIPNRITLNEKIYNTTDGTPWFVINAYNYYLYSGDSTFIKKIYNTIQTATNSALKNRTDKNCFLIHEDAETWMDAVGPKGPWSPRGNRANDIQALWFRQLVLSSEIAQINNDSENQSRWLDAAIKLKESFNSKFINQDEAIIYDHLDSNNTPSKEIRPNAFFALNTEDLFLSSGIKLKLMKRYFNELVFPYGVLSLSQSDSNFHPYHHYEPYYVQDAAYHNGIIWLWNSGTVISNLLSFHLSDIAYELTSSMIDITLNKFAVGTLPELLDAFPRNNEQFPLASGTFTQAWSMAEFVRNFYQDYLGVQPDASKNTIYLLPSLPQKINYAKFKIRISNSSALIEYKNNSENFEIEIDGKNIKDSVDFGISLVNSKNVNYLFKFQLNKDDNAKIVLRQTSEDLSGIKLLINDKIRLIRVLVQKDPDSNQTVYKGFRFAKPEFNKNWSSIKSPEYELLSHSIIKSKPNYSDIIFSVDSKNIINNNYTLPENPNFLKGITELKNFQINADDNNYFFSLKFSKLTNPGWHNEFGFQLTFVSIAVQSNVNEETNVEIKNNSNFILDKDYAFNRLINIGGGIEVLNAKHKILAKYIPATEDIKNPLGNTKENLISFSIPKKVLGQLTPETKFVLLIGMQDDHGGAGIGEFRTVNKTASEWMGGGKSNEKNSNVFQYLKIN